MEPSTFSVVSWGKRVSEFLSSRSDRRAADSAAKMSAQQKSSTGQRSSCEMRTLSDLWVDLPGENRQSLKRHHARCDRLLSTRRTRAQEHVAFQDGDLDGQVATHRSSYDPSYVDVQRMESCKSPTRQNGYLPPSERHDTEHRESLTQSGIRKGEEEHSYRQQEEIRSLEQRNTELGKSLAEQTRETFFWFRKDLARYKTQKLLQEKHKLLQEILKETQDNIAKLLHESQHLQGENQLCGRTIRQLEVNGQDVQRRLDMESQAKKEIHQDLLAAQKQVEELKSDLQSTQLANFRKNNHAVWISEEDGDIRDAIGQLFKDIRQWSKKYAVRSSAEYTDISSGQFPEWTQELNKMTYVRDYQTPEEVARQFVCLKSPYVVLCAFLSFEMHESIFSNSFFFLNNIDQGRALQKTFERQLPGNPKEAHMWRSQTVRMFFSRRHDVNGGQLQWSDDIEPGVRVSCSRMAANFLNGPMKGLLRPSKVPEADVQATELSNIFQRAAFLFARNQAERTYFKWFPAQEVLSQQFSVASEKLEADRLHKLEDDQDRSHDGKLAGLVLSPLVIAFGNPDAEDYEKQRIISKAVVWLIDGPKPAAGATLVQEEEPVSQVAHGKNLDQENPTPPQYQFNQSNAAQLAQGNNLDEPRCDGPKQAAETTLLQEQESVRVGHEKSLNKQLLNDPKRTTGATLVLENSASPHDQFNQFNVAQVAQGNNLDIPHFDGPKQAAEATFVHEERPVSQVADGNSFNTRLLNGPKRATGAALVQEHPTPTHNQFKQGSFAEAAQGKSLVIPRSGGLKQAAKATIVRGKRFVSQVAHGNNLNTQPPKQATGATLVQENPTSLYDQFIQLNLAQGNNLNMRRFGGPKQAVRARLIRDGDSKSPQDQMAHGNDKTIDPWAELQKKAGVSKSTHFKHLNAQRPEQATGATLVQEIPTLPHNQLNKWNSAPVAHGNTFDKGPKQAGGMSFTKKDHPPSPHVQYGPNQAVRGNPSDFESPADQDEDSDPMQM